MKINANLMNSHIFISMIFLALAVYLFYHTYARKSVNAKSNKRTLVGSLVSATVGVVYLAMYVMYIN